MSNTPKVHKSIIRNVNFGENVSIIEPVNIYECEIGNNHCKVRWCSGSNIV